MQIKTTVSYHHHSPTEQIKDWQYKKTREGGNNQNLHIYTATGRLKWYHHFEIFKTSTL